MDAKRIVILSGPSGVGKSTVVSRLISQCDIPIALSISATTREPRRGEVDGKDYLFLSDDEFQKRREAGEFLECKEVFGRGYWYGTLKETVTTGLLDGKWVLLEIDVEGALSVKQEFPDVLMVFLHPGSMEILESRLRNRKTDSEEAILRRLSVASKELEQSSQYNHVVENQTIEHSVEEICRILRSHDRSQVQENV